MAESNELRQEFYNSSTIYEGIQTLQTEAQLFEKSPVQSLEYKYFNLFMIYSELSYLYGKQEKLKEKKIFFELSKGECIKRGLNAGLDSLSAAEIAGELVNDDLFSVFEERYKAKGVVWLNKKQQQEHSLRKGVR